MIQSCSDILMHLMPTPYRHLRLAAGQTWFGTSNVLLKYMMAPLILMRQYGVFKLILDKKHPEAINIHCYAHELNLCYTYKSCP